MNLNCPNCQKKLRQENENWWRCTNQKCNQEKGQINLIISSKPIRLMSP